MKKDEPVWFPRWKECLEQSGLPAGRIQDMTWVIRWYLSFCKRGRVRATFQSARDFLDSAQQEKRPTPASLEQWKEAIRWFFRAASAQRSAVSGQRPAIRDQRSEVGGHPRSPGGQARDKGGEPQWLVKMRAVLRVRHYAYRTEQTYLDWAKRFVRYHEGKDPAQLDEQSIRSYLEHLAVQGRVGAKTQRQALNAVVFLFGQVLEREMGDFSDYQRAQARSRMPVVLSRAEVSALWDSMEGTHRLMARTMYGSGLRLMELIRLRVKDVDLERMQITVRGGKGD
jgi:integrase